MRSTHRALSIAIALAVLPAVGWALFLPVPNVYKPTVYETAPPFLKAGKLTWKFTALLGKLIFKAKFISAPQPPGDGLPCSGDEPVCLIDGTLLLPPTPGQLVFRPEVNPTGTAALFSALDPLATPAALGFAAFSVSSGTCYVAQPMPPPAVPLGASPCSGWYFGVPPLVGPLFSF